MWKKEVLNADIEISQVRIFSETKPSGGHIILPSKYLERPTKLRRGVGSNMEKFMCIQGKC